MFLCTTPHRPNRPGKVFFAAFCASVSIFLVPLCFSQAEAPSATPAQTTVVNANEVSLNLVVRNKKGKLVADLKPEDIAVTDGGVAVKISSLRLVSGEGGEHLLTMVFDRMDSAGGHNARDIAGKILKMVPAKGFSFSVLKVESRLMLYQDFTLDRAALTKAIAQAVNIEEAAGENGAMVAEKRLIAVARTGSDESGIRVAAGERTAAQVLLAALQDSQKVMQEQHTHSGLAGLLALARAEQRIPGRKTIIYFAQGLEADSNAADQVRNVIGAANRAGVSIYAIDTNALTAQEDQSMLAMTAIGNARSAMAQQGPTPTSTGSGASSQTVAQPPPGLAPMVNNQFDRYETADANANKSPLIGLAESTGGAYVSSGGDIKKPLHRMIEDMTTYYEASYAPPIESFDGQFRPIAVKPVREGLKISSRAGYFALPPDSGQVTRPFEAPLLKLLSESSLPTDIGFHARVLHLGDMPTGNENTLVVEAPLSALETRDDPNAGLYSLHVSIVAQIRNKAGAVVGHFGEDIPRHGALDSNGGPKLGFVTMQRHFTAEPGEYVLEAAVLDHNSGKTGAQRVEFTIPNSPAGPSLSDLTMVQRIDPVPQEADPEEPMRYGAGRVVPAISGRVSKGTKQLSFFFVVHTDSESADQPRLEMEILKSGEPIAQVPLALGKTSGPATVPYLASIQAAGLPSGEYQVIERLTQGGKTAEHDLAFQIEGSDAASEGTARNGVGAAKDEAESVTASGSEWPAGDGPSGHRLVITSLPSSSVPPPTSDQLQAIIEGARKRALDYGKSLPNFICVEVTNRSVDQTGNGNWKHRDSIAEMLSYHNNAETRTTLEVNGRRSTLTRAEMNSTWPLSVGEFGAMLNLVFQPSSKTSFEWKEAASLGDGSGTMQVLSYRVAKENATIVLTQGNDEVGVAFHGLVYIDVATGGVRRVTLNADGVPRSFPVRSATMTVDYDYVAIAGRDYLLPVRSTVSVQKGHKKIELNEIAFRNYRRFASRTKIKMAQ